MIIPSFIACIREWTFGNTQAWCGTTSSFTVCVNLSIVLSVLLIAIDRNCAVNSPLHYAVTITKKRTTLLIRFIWIVSVVLAVPTFFGVPELEERANELSELWNFSRATAMVYTSTLCLVGFIIPLIGVTGFYFAMFRAAETNNARARRSSSNSCLSSEVVVNIKPPKNFGENEYSLRRNFSSEQAEPKNGYCCFAGKHKAAMTGLIVVFSFIACWLLYFLCLVYQQFRVVRTDITFWIQLATYLSSIVDPYVYFYRNKNMWKQTKRLLLLKFCRNSDFIIHPVAKRNRADTTKFVFRLPTSFSQTVLSTQVPITRNFSHNSIPEDKAHRHMVLSPEFSPGVFSVHPIKSLIHQDSSSSNDSSDACVTSVVLGSTVSLDGATMWYQAFHNRVSEDSMTEIPLDDTIAI